jgi:DNA-binding transcriptional ArsR family regulator
MVTFQFTLDDLARTRFAISPMWELVSGLRALREPANAALHLPWVSEALPAARELGLDTALALTPPTGYIPDFLTPPPSTPLATFEEELELVRTTSAAQVRTDLRELIRCHDGAGARVDEMIERPRYWLNRLAEELEAFWRSAMEPYWPRVRSLLEADIHHRSRRLVEGGPAALFADLHPDVEWKDAELFVRQKVCVFDSPLRGKGLLMIPSAFYANRPATITDPPWQPTLLYPARGLALLWDEGEQAAPKTLAAVIGRTRADLLELLDAPRSTTELAPRLELSAGAISQHLTALRSAGLVTAERHGRAVLYLRTPAADRLFEAAAQPA